MTACAFNETSMGVYETEAFVDAVIQQLKEDSSRINDNDFDVTLDGGAFTYALVQAMGLHYPECTADDALSGDTNGDGVLTLSEAYSGVSKVMRGKPYRT